MAHVTGYCLRCGRNGREHAPNVKGGYDDAVAKRELEGHGKLQPAVYDLLAHAQLSPARSGLKGNWSQLMCGSTLRRLIGTTWAVFDKELMSGLTGDMQFAVDGSAGIELQGLTLQTLLEEARDLAFLQFDAVSAFISMSRERVLDRVREVAPHLLDWTSIWLTRESTAVQTSACGQRMCIPARGVLDQADPLSPFLFALGLPVRSIQPQRPMAMVSFLDCMTLAIDPPLAAQGRQVVTKELLAVGQEINHRKSALRGTGGRLQADMTGLCCVANRASGKTRV